MHTDLHEDGSFKIGKFADEMARIERLAVANSAATLRKIDSGFRIVIGWGHHDRLCLSTQTARAKLAFPPPICTGSRPADISLNGDQPDETFAVILAATR